MSARSFYKSLNALAIAALAAAGYCSGRIAVADWLFRANTLASVSRAAALDPTNAAYHAWLAEIQEHDGRDPTAELETAARLNPSDSAVLIRLGLRAETQRDLPRAEIHLLEAARIDKLFAPRWTLANFYLRNGDTERFWPWARQALDISYGDLTPLFQLCWRASQEPSVILARAIPPQHAVLGKYLSFLLKENRLDAAAPVASRFLDEAVPADLSLALTYCDRLIERRSAAPAIVVWNKLCDRKLIPYSPGQALTNGNFQYAPLEQGFDWRTATDAEISVTRSQSPPELRFHLSGKQPEHCELLSQFIPGGQYIFHFEYRTTIPGLEWTGSGTSFHLPLNKEWTPQQFPVTRGGALDRIALIYSRPTGEPRAEGEIWLRNTSIAPAPQQP